MVLHHDQQPESVSPCRIRLERRIKAAEREVIQLSELQKAHDEEKDDEP